MVGVSPPRLRSLQVCPVKQTRTPVAMQTPDARCGGSQRESRYAINERAARESPCSARCSHAGACGSPHPDGEPRCGRQWHAGERITSSAALQLDDDRLCGTRNEGEVDATKARPQRRDDPERRSGLERGFRSLSDVARRVGAAWLEVVALVQPRDATSSGEVAHGARRLTRQFGQEIVEVRGHESEACGVHLVLVQQRIE